MKRKNIGRIVGFTLLGILGTGVVIYLASSLIVASGLKPNQSTKPKPLWEYDEVPFDIIKDPKKDANKIGDPKRIDLSSGNVQLKSINDHAYQTKDRDGKKVNVLMLDFDNLSTSTRSVTSNRNVDITPAWFAKFSDIECQQIQYINIWCDNHISLNLKENSFAKFKNIKGLGIFNNYDKENFIDERYSTNQINIELNAIPKSVVSLAFEQDFAPIKSNNQNQIVGLFKDYINLENFTCYIKIKNLWLNEKDPYNSFLPFNKNKRVEDLLPKLNLPNDLSHIKLPEGIVIPPATSLPPEIIQMIPDGWTIEQVVKYCFLELGALGWYYLTYYQAPAYLPDLFFANTPKLKELNFYGYSNHLVVNDKDYIDSMPSHLFNFDLKPFKLFLDFSSNAFEGSSLFYELITLGKLLTSAFSLWYPQLAKLNCESFIATNSIATPIAKISR